MSMGAKCESEEIEIRLMLCIANLVHITYNVRKRKEKQNG